MKDFVAVHQWIDQGAAPLDPATMQFKSKLADKDAGKCSGCVFNKQNWRVCKAAAALAVKAEWRDCDDNDEETGMTFVYILVRGDVRQMSIEGVEQAG